MTYQDEVLGQLKAQTALLTTISKQLEAMANEKNVASQYEWTPEGLPICPRHQEVMKRREKQGDTWYSHRVTDDQGKELFCRGYASKSSPGWDIDPDDTPPPPPPPAKPAPAKLPKQDIDEMDYHEHEPPPAQPEPTTPQPNPQVAAIFNQPDLAPAQQPGSDPNYRKLFYDIGSKAMQEKRIAFDKFNSLVSLADVDSWSAALAGLRLTLEGGSV